MCGLSPANHHSHCESYEKVRHRHRSPATARDPSCGGVALEGLGNRVYECAAGVRAEWTRDLAGRLIIELFVIIRVAGTPLTRALSGRANRGPEGPERRCKTISGTHLAGGGPRSSWTVGLTIGLLFIYLSWSALSRLSCDDCVTPGKSSTCNITCKV